MYSTAFIILIATFITASALPINWKRPTSAPITFVTDKTGEIIGLYVPGLNNTKLNEPFRRSEERRQKWLQSLNQSTETSVTEATTESEVTEATTEP
ncbi:hypothetical protein PFISCL1PPCAC_25285, partial [Pristionchus fissidentatus]